MNLKQRFSITFSLLFSIVLGTVLVFIFVFFSRYRREEFSERLEHKAASTLKILFEVQEIDDQMLRIFDKNTINKLYNEKVLIFNSQGDLIYASPDDIPLEWDKNDLAYLQKNKQFYRKTNEYDTFGKYYETPDNGYYAIVTAEDKYGNRKLDYLKILLFTSFIIGTIAVWMLSFYMSKIGLRPLDRLSERIKNITDKNLSTRLSVQNPNSEIGSLSIAFNQMIDRIDNAYNKQKEFTGNASHELRTPISRIAAQLENILGNPEIPDKPKEILKGINDEVYQLSEVVTSLLLLSKVNTPDEFSKLPIVRLDEIIFSAIGNVNKQFPNLRLTFHIQNETLQEPNFELKGDELLLSIAFENLLKNAAQYSDNQLIDYTLRVTPTHLFSVFRNTGETPQVENTATLFNAFLRGNNAINKPGSGLGLSIVKRIIEYHHADIQYFIPAEKTNEISIRFHRETSDFKKS